MRGISVAQYYNNLDSFSSLSSPSLALNFFITVNKIHIFLPLPFLLGQTVLPTFLLLLPQSVSAGRPAQGPDLWESSFCLEGPEDGGELPEMGCCVL